ncbi:ribosomal protein L7/L12 [Trypanosoma cruzi Dm28c]|uniref:Ribosomal protein L7/L12 n=2 Tax=Trypanosoma cruzi TaxID=5693 RepID=V5BGN2_TRYCR|nr:ribosomal protein L7/L12 [Trypanosoma cruzi Dm28c]
MGDNARKERCVLAFVLTFLALFFIASISGKQQFGFRYSFPLPTVAKDITARRHLLCCLATDANAHRLSYLHAFSSLFFTPHEGYKSGTGFMRRVQTHTKAEILFRWFTIGGVTGTAMPRGMQAFPLRDSAETIETIAEAYVNMDLATMRKFHESVLKSTTRTCGTSRLSYEQALLQGIGAGNSWSSMGTVGVGDSALSSASSPTRDEALASDNAALAKKVAEKTAFDFTVKKYPSANKVKLIKELRAVSGLPLHEAKTAVEKCPGVLVKAMARADAEKLKALFEEHGAEVELL